MSNDKNNADNNSSDQQKEGQENEHVKNPFEPGKGKEITQEDIDNEQKFKEALSERD